MEDTIAAVATAIGEGGIGIVRISGNNAEKILRDVFKPAGCGGDFDKALQNRRFSYGHVVDVASGRIVDEAMAVLMRGPKTYTTEDVAEIHCHGGRISLKKTLRSVISCGARPAEKGEFTKRAFLNGRLDLSQAEAVMDLVSAKTGGIYDLALCQVEGVLSRKIKDIRGLIKDLLTEITVNIDYPDEDIEELTYGKLIDNLLAISDMIQKLGQTIGKGKLLREGVRAAIVGKPNVGKSSLMNALLREQRVIVSDIAGTTRDTIEEAVDIGGVPVNLIDTAGIRRTADVIESIGVERSKKSVAEADLVICVVDGSEELSAEDEEVLGFLEPDRSVVLLNKADLGSVVTAERIRKSAAGVRVIKTALTEEIGLLELEKAIGEMVYGGDVFAGDDVMITNVRHADIIEKSLSAICDATCAAKGREPLDLVEVDVVRAYELLGEVVGETVSGDIIDEVFRRFCLGK